MCGIVYVKRLDHARAAKQALKRYSKQAHRGTDGFGYIGIKSNGTISPLQRTQFEHEITAKLKQSTLTEILFHHRFPTSTPNVPESAHPLFIANKELKYNYYVVHNGVISNDNELYDTHEALGYVYQTEVKTQYRTKKGHVYTEGIQFNDSEAFAIELARTIEGLQPEVMAKGAIAYIAYQVDKTSGKVEAVYFGRNAGNPLLVQRTKEFIVIASEGAGLKTDADKSYKLNPATNEIVEVPIKLQPLYVPNSVGFHRTTKVYDSYNWDNHSRNPQTAEEVDEYIKYVPSYAGDEHMTLAEIEEELSAVEDEIIGTAGDVAYARTQGEDEDIYQQDYQNLIARRTKLQTLYERKANATA